MCSEDDNKSKNGGNGSFKTGGNGCVKLKRHNACRQKSREVIFVNEDAKVDEANDTVSTYWFFFLSHFVHVSCITRWDFILCRNSKLCSKLGRIINRHDDFFPTSKWDEKRPVDDRFVAILI